MKYITSGMLAYLVDVPKTTIRHYINLDLLTPAKIDDNGYQLFDEMQVYRLYYIRFLRGIGYSLTEIATLLTQDDLHQALQTANQQLTEKISALQKTQQTITAILTAQAQQPLNITQFIKQPRRYFEILNEDIAQSLELKMAQQMAQADLNLHQLKPITYLKRPTDTTPLFVQTTSTPETAITVPAGTYLTVHLPVINEHQIDEALDKLLADNDFKTAPTILIYENIPLSLVYGQTIIYTLEVHKP